MGFHERTWISVGARFIEPSVWVTHIVTGAVHLHRDPSQNGRTACKADVALACSDTMSVNTLGDDVSDPYSGPINRGPTFVRLPTNHSYIPRFDTTSITDSFMLVLEC